MTRCLECDSECVEMVGIVPIHSPHLQECQKYECLVCGFEFFIEMSMDAS
jgi:hypothetical protein